MIRKLTHIELKSARPSLKEMESIDRFPVTVVLENIRSLYNVGSMFRTSDGASIEFLYLCGYTGYPPRKEIDKTALGSVESVNWKYEKNTVEAVQNLKRAGNQIISLEHTDKSVPYTEAEYKFPLTVILGNEVDGISNELVLMSDMAVEIPMYGIKQSLNVSVSYGIIIYHIIQYYKERYGQ